MKLGTQTGSIVNYLMSGTNGQPVPEIGMGITLLYWTDRSAGTITRVSPSGKTFWFKADLATRTDDNGMSEQRIYEHTPGNGPEMMAKPNAKGAWHYKGTRIRLGSRSTYHDYSF